MLMPTRLKEDRPKFNHNRKFNLEGLPAELGFFLVEFLIYSLKRSWGVKAHAPDERY